MRSREYTRDGNVLTLHQGGADPPQSLPEATRDAHEKLSSLAAVLDPEDPIFDGVEAIRDALRLRLARRR